MHNPQDFMLVHNARRDAYPALFPAFFCVKYGHFGRFVLLDLNIPTSGFLYMDSYIVYFQRFITIIKTIV